MKKVLILFLFLFSVYNSYCQRLSIEYNFGFGLSSLSELKEFQKELLELLPSLPLESVESFPYDICNSLIIDYKLSERSYLGTSFSFISTGARNSLKDYSGEIRQDLILNGFKAGIIYRFTLESFKNSQLFFQSGSGIRFSSLKYEGLLEIYSIVRNNEESTFKGTSAFIEPGLGYKYNFYKYFAINAKILYEYSFDCKLKMDDMYLAHLNGNPLNLDWSGLRLLAGISVSF